MPLYPYASVPVRRYTSAPLLLTKVGAMGRALARGGVPWRLLSGSEAPVSFLSGVLFVSWVGGYGEVLGRFPFLGRLVFHCGFDDEGFVVSGSGVTTKGVKP